MGDARLSGGSAFFRVDFPGTHYFVCAIAKNKNLFGLASARTSKPGFFIDEAIDSLNDNERKGSAR